VKKINKIANLALGNSTDTYSQHKNI